MADEWIKMRRNLLNHPKVVRITSALLADKFRTVGGLHAVWSVFDEFSEDGRLNGYSLSAMDITIGWPGFCEAMAAVGWLFQDGQTLVVPEFDEHNGASGKRRSQESKRKRDVRNASASDADKIRTKSALEEEEESLDQKKELSPTPHKAKKAKPPKREGDPEGFADFWALYPRKDSRATAVKAFAKLQPSQVVSAMAAIVKFAASWKWRTEPEYIPYGATWLNEHRFNDPPPPEHPPGTKQKPTVESRQARQLRVLEETTNDPRYSQTAQRQLAQERHQARAAALDHAEPALDASPGSFEWDPPGVD